MNAKLKRRIPVDPTLVFSWWNDHDGLGEARKARFYLIPREREPRELLSYYDDQHGDHFECAHEVFGGLDPNSGMAKGLKFLRSLPPGRRAEIEEAISTIAFKAFRFGVEHGENPNPLGELPGHEWPEDEE